MLERNSVKQSELRRQLAEAMIERVVQLGMPDLEACFILGDPNDPVFDKDIEKAMDSAYYALNDSLRQISRIATRLGYIDKQQPDTTQQ